ncbi:MAG: hypothetical protein U0350_16140 [Caldilineaceae bacterium]
MPHFIVTDEGLTLGEREVGRVWGARWSRALRTGSQALEAVWRSLRNDWLLITCGCVVLIVAASSYYLRQMPGQLADDPLAAARWLMTTSTEYGFAGDLLRSLGLFDLPRSPLLHLLLALIGLILFVRLGDQLATVWRYQQVTKQLAAQGTEAGAPLPLSSLQVVYRWRQAQPLPPAELNPRLQAYLTTKFPTVTPQTVDLPTTSTTQDNTVQETRLLAIRQRQWMLMRPLVFIGLLLLWAVIGLILSAGWMVMPTPLAPGAEYRYAPHEFTLQYQVEQQANGVAPQLEARIGKRSQQLSATTKGHMQLDQVEIETMPGPPGLLISTPNGQPLLRRPGQRNTVAAIGLTFPNPGSEESLILTETVVLRIVRRAEANAFAVEVYQGKDQQPGQRLDINQTATYPVPMNGQPVNLHFALLPSLNVEASYLPGIWLSWVALALMLLGAVGFWFRPAFLLAQIAPWPEQRSVLVVQGDRADEVAALREWVNQT